MIREISYLVNVYYYFYYSKLFPWLFFSYKNLVSTGGSQRMFFLSYLFLVLYYSYDLFIMINGKWNTSFFFLTWIEPKIIASLIFTQKGMLKSVNIHIFFLMQSQDCNMPIYTKSRATQLYQNGFQKENWFSILLSLLKQ